MIFESFKRMLKLLVIAFEVQVENPIPLAVQSSNVTSNGKSKLVRRSHIFNAPSFTDTITLSTSDNATFNEQSGNVTFNFLLSPVLLMPPLKILRTLILFFFAKFKEL